jgi:acetylornithine deacetylase/succinyl-diaminopimelate desuccinylase-like protein
LDTVLAPRKPEDIAVNGSGRFEGPGVADNGCGLAGLLALAQALRRHDILGESAGRVVFIANVGEEGEGNLSGMRFLCRKSEMGERISAILVLDGPATDRITSRAIASKRFEITVEGPGGHSWSDFGVANPVHALSRAVTVFVDHRKNGRPGSGQPRSTYNFGVVDGGASVNAIPSRASAKLDLRSEEPESIGRMVAIMTAALERSLGVEHSRCSGPRLTARVREIGSRPGGALSANAPILQYLKAVDAHLGIRSVEDCASTDANIPLSMGLQALSIGAGGSGGGAHTPDEWYDPEGREIGLRRALLVIYLLANSAGEAAKR